MSFEPFRPRFPWYGRHLQSLRNPLRPAPRLPNGPGRRLAFRLPDGDALQACHDAPLERDRAAPSILLIHGLGGCETSNYMLAASAFFTSAGSDVYRLNLRGAGPSQATCRGWSHAGRHRDLEAVIPELPVGRSGIVAIGFSLGGNLLLNHLARGAVDDGLRAAASVSAPIDLEIGRAHV